MHDACGPSKLRYLEGINRSKFPKNVSDYLRNLKHKHINLRSRTKLLSKGMTLSAQNHFLTFTQHKLSLLASVTFACFFRVSLFITKLNLLGELNGKKHRRSDLYHSLTF